LIRTQEVPITIRMLFSYLQDAGSVDPRGPSILFSVLFTFTILLFCFSATRNTTP